MIVCIVYLLRHRAQLVARIRGYLVALFLVSRLFRP